MIKEKRRAIFEANGKREGLSLRVLEIAKQIIEVGSLKRAIIGAGQIKALAEIAVVDSYWDEKCSYGYQVESDILNGSRKCTFNSYGSIVWDELVEIKEEDQPND